MRRAVLHRIYLAGYSGQIMPRWLRKFLMHIDGFQYPERPTTMKARSASMPRAVCSSADGRPMEFPHQMPTGARQTGQGTARTG